MIKGIKQIINDDYKRIHKYDDTNNINEIINSIINKYNNKFDDKEDKKKIENIIARHMIINYDNREFKFNTKIINKITLNELYDNINKKINSDIDIDTDNKISQDNKNNDNKFYTGYMDIKSIILSDDNIKQNGQNNKMNCEYKSLRDDLKIKKNINKFKYSFPEYKIYNNDKLLPKWTQWIHDEQNDDYDLNNIDDKIKRRIEEVNYLSNIEYPEQRSEEWFKQRDGKITASDAGCIIGDNKYEMLYKFYKKKIFREPFSGGLACYHGKKYEQIATMVYEYRMNVRVKEYGLVGHKKYDFLGASPDGIVGIYKYDNKHKTSLVGRMLEIKVPLWRKILQKGEIKGEICPIYYWDQVQLQLECCDLDECDFWQCEIQEYNDRNEFLDDTDPREPYKSIKHNLEKGCLIQLLPKDKYTEVIQNPDMYLDIVYDYASFIYPDTLELSPEECDEWISKTLSNIDKTHSGYVFDKVIYWKLVDSNCSTIYRDKEWFNIHLPTYESVWNNIVYMRNNVNIAKKIYEHKKVIKLEKKLNEILDKINNKNEFNKLKGFEKAKLFNNKKDIEYKINDRINKKIEYYKNKLKNR